MINHPKRLISIWFVDRKSLPVLPVLKIEIPDLSPQVMLFCQQLKVRKKQQIVLIWTKTPKKERPSRLGNFSCLCSEKERLATWRRYRMVWITWKRRYATLKNHCSKLVLNNRNSLVAATNLPNHGWNFSSIPAYDHISKLIFCQTWILFLFRKELCTTATKPMTLCWYKRCNYF